MSLSSGPSVAINSSGFVQEYSLFCACSGYKFCNRRERGSPGDNFPFVFQVPNLVTERGVPLGF